MNNSIRISALILLLLAVPALFAQQPETNSRINQMSSLTGLADTRDYKIGPGDLLEISIFGVEKFNQTVRVSSSGQVSIPFLGKVNVNGMTALQLEDEVTKQMTDNKLIINPQVSVFVKDYMAHPVFVLGAVNKPGQVMMTQPLKLVDLLAIAGGIDLNRSDDFLLLQRQPDVPVGEVAENGHDGGDGGGSRTPLEKTPTTTRVDLKDLLEKGNMALNVPIQGGDVIQVPERKIELFYIIGEVAHAAAYEYPHDQEKVLLSQAIAWAGGPMKTAKLSKGTLIRYDDKGNRQEMAVDFGGIIKGKKPDVPVKPNDVIFIPGSNIKNIGYGLLGMVPGSIGQAWSGYIVYRPRVAATTK